MDYEEFVSSRQKNPSVDTIDKIDMTEKKNYDNTPKNSENASENISGNTSKISSEEIPLDIFEAKNASDLLSSSEMDLSALQENLTNCLQIIDDEVMKGYVTRLDELPIIHMDSLSYGDLQETLFYKITELVYQQDEFSVDKLAMVFGTLSNKPCTVVLMLKSNGESTDFYIGARPNDNRSPGTLAQLMKNSLLGFFPGSRISEYYDEDMKRDMQSIKAGSISSVTCVADYNSEEKTVTNQNFIQGLEKFVYIMQGKSYTAVFIADNLSYEELMERKLEYAQIYTQISPFANVQMNFTQSDSKSISDTVTRGKGTTTSDAVMHGTSETDTSTTAHTVGKNDAKSTTDTVNEVHTDTENSAHADGTSTSQSETKTESISVTTTKGRNVNASIAVVGGGKSNSKSKSSSSSTGYTKSSSVTISDTLSHGFSNSKGTSRSESTTSGTSESDSESQGKAVSSNQSYSHNIGETLNFSVGNSVTDMLGTSKAITLNAKDMTLEPVMKKIQKHIERIEECESFGMWDFAAYFLAETASESQSAANIYKAVIEGKNSGIERSAINSWSNKQSVILLLPYIQKFLHPHFIYKGFSYDKERYVDVTPSALVSTKELALHMGLPRHSVKGLPVTEHAAFAKEVITRENSQKATISLGKVFDLGQETNTPVKLAVKSLAMHTFITGSTGSGKSNTIYTMLDRLSDKKVKFLVVEPAKGEYKTVFGGRSDISVYGTNPNLANMNLLHINPFSFPKDIHVLEHIDRLVEIFNVCWPMYAAMPAILKDSVERAYVAAGWDLMKSTNQYDNHLFPTFVDVLKEIKAVLAESDYSADNKGDYTGSLVTRVRSLTNGINGLIFSSDDISDEQLFDENVIVDLSRVGSTETKALIMGMLVLKLQEHRMDASLPNSDLKHVTVLEEAHNLLKRTSTEQVTEGANLLGKSVEMLANSIAEMRTYGEGFIIADQSPGLLDMSVIRNTNTKIIMRLPDFADRELVGKAAALNDHQIEELARLEKGVAAVYQNEWLEPVLCKVDKYESRYDLPHSTKESPYKQTVNSDEVSRSLLECIMSKEIYRKGDRVDIQRLKQDILRSKLDTSVKCDFIDYITSKSERAMETLRTLVYDFLKADKAVNASRKCRDLSEWVHSVADNLSPSVKDYSIRQIDLVMALLIYEQSLRDSSYNDILCRFAEIYQSEGGVF